MIKLKLLGLGILFFTIISIFSYQLSHSYFSDSGNSTSNVFAAAAEFPTPTPPIAQTLVMNEILPISSCESGQDPGQFLELWNGSGGDVDLQQFKLSDGTNTIAIANSNTSLANGAFAILVKSNGIINQCLHGDVSGATTVNLGGQIDLNTGLLRLLDKNNVVIDRVEFGSSNSGILQTVADQSIERKQIGFDTAFGDNFAVSDFAKQCPPTPGTWAAPTGQCRILISEVQIATSSATGSDFVELYNPTSSAINLNNYRLVKRTSSGVVDVTIKAFTNSNIIPAHGFFLWASTAGGYATQLGADVSSGDSLSADNSVAIRNGSENTGTIIDALSWGAPSGTPLLEGSSFTPNPTAGKSIERKAYSSSTQSTMEGGTDDDNGNSFDTDHNSTDFILRNISQPQKSTSTIELP